MSRQRDVAYFSRIPDSPSPLLGIIERRVAFNEVDPMGVVWHGRYATFFEQGAADLGRKCSLSYADFMGAQILAPIVTFHVDYYEPLYLDDTFTIETRMIWDDAAKLNTEHTLKRDDGTITTSAHTVQLLIDAATNEVCLAPPDVLLKCQERWKSGEFAKLQ